MASSNTSEQDLIDSLFESLEAELSREPLYNSAILESKIDDAVSEFKLRRGYEYSSLSEDQIVEDMVKHKSIIKKVALIWYNRIGAEGESYHYENTVHRSMWTDDELFAGVVPFVKVL